MTASDWRGMFEQPGGGGRPPAGVPPAPPNRAEPGEEEGPSLDLSVYRPWILQRGRSRPAMMLDLRRFEPRSGMWTGWAVAYPHLVAVEYTGDRLVSLDFGTRQFVLEGQGLGDLVRHLQLGIVVAINEYAPTVWAAHSNGGVISTIRLV
jgi:hypothetical protein